MNDHANKGYKGMSMEGAMARWYARGRMNEMEHFRGEARRVADRLHPGAAVLEVAPGPGFFAVELAKLGDFSITGLDISRTFVEMCRERARQENVKIDFQLGNVSQMPFGDESFDRVYCSAAFKNFSEPVKALDEMHRVLKPGGEALIVDLRKDVSLDEVNEYLRQSGRNRFDAWVTGLIFKHMLVKRAYTSGDFLRMGCESRFGACDVKSGPIGFDVRLEKPAGVGSAVA